MRIRLLGAPVDGLTLEQSKEAILTKIDRGNPGFVITLNPELLYRAQHQKKLLDMIGRADLVTADGVGIVWACEVSGHPVPERVTGIDLMLGLLERAGVNGLRVFFLGSAPGVAEAAAKKAEEMYPGLQVVGTYHGYFDNEDNDKVIDAIVKASPHMVFVALGAPRQELWIDQNLSRLGNIVAMGVGGSLDVLSGNVERVPVWFQKRNLEWLGRLLNQPSRWRRMLVLPKFALLVLKTYRIRKFFS